MYIYRDMYRNRIWYCNLWFVTTAGSSWMPHISFVTSYTADLCLFRMLSHFKIVWRLVYGLLTAGQTILSMTMLIAVSLFIFACVAVE